MPRISIIIPIHNASRDLPKCLDSIINQTFVDIEIICIDDCSLDNSWEIIQEYVESDARFYGIRYDSKKSASQARKDGVAKASGDYIMFLDADDYLESDACEKLLGYIEKHDVDILHFGTRVINSSNVSESRIASIEKFVRPFHKHIKGQEVFDACFVDHHFHFTLWNKIYKTSLCKKAFSQIPDGYFPKAQDLMAFVFIASYAESYYGITDHFYNYCFGNGVSGSDTINLQNFEIICQQSFILPVIETFFEFSGKMNEYRSVISELKNRLINECISKWYDFISVDDSSVGFDLLIKYWGQLDIVTRISNCYYRDQVKLARKICGASSLSARRRRIRGIGVYYHRISIGGVQRVLSKLIPIWAQMGYMVYFFSDEPPAEDDYELPPEIKRIVLPSCFDLRSGEYQERVKAWHQNIEALDIDLILYNAASSPLLMTDIISIKSKGILFALTIHELFSHAMATGNRSISDRPYIYQLVDELIVLSRIEQKYWQILGLSASYIPNPLTFNLEDVQTSKLDQPNIIWIGRFDHGKQYLDAIEIFAEVVRIIPTAKMFMVGKDVLANANSKITKLINKLNINEQVVLCGQQMDVGPYYQEASIHLMTSIAESSSMTISESKSFGIPCVLYELPYLEILQDGEGYVSVDQGDVKAASRAIIKLLSNPTDLNELGQKARMSIENFSHYDLFGAWQKVFQNLEREPVQVFEDRDDKMLCNIIKTMLFHYQHGHVRLLQEIADRQNAQTVGGSQDISLWRILVALGKKCLPSVVYRFFYTIKHFGVKEALVKAKKFYGKGHK